MNIDDLTISKAEEVEEFEIAKEMFSKYLDELGVDLSFQQFKEELHNLPTYYRSPKGFLLLLKNKEGKYIASAGVRFLNKEKCEFKRMYVLPEFRDQGVGQHVLKQCIIAARDLGFQKVQLDTLGRLEKAIKHYKTLGFTQIPPFRFNPYDDAMYFEYKL